VPTVATARNRLNGIKDQRSKIKTKEVIAAQRRFRIVAFCYLHFDLSLWLCQEHNVSPEEKLIPIGPAAKKAGVSRQSLQYYIMIGLLEPTQVTPTGRRLFDAKAIERIQLIKRLNSSGYPLRAIRELFMEGRTDLKGSSGE